MKYSHIPLGAKVNVVWADHFSTDPHTGYDLEEISNLSKPCIRETPGFFILEKRQTITIADTKEDDGTFTELTVFMKKSVIRIEEL